MTESNYGGSPFTFFTAEAVNRKDDVKKAGRVSLRIHGVDDDKTNIPDNMLSWGIPMLPATSPSMNGVGTVPHGIMEGSKVYGFFADIDKTIPVILGTMHRSDTTQSNGDTSQTNGNVPNDLNVNGRSIKDFNQVINANMIALAANNALFNTLKSIGTHNLTAASGLSLLSSLGNNGAKNGVQDLIKQIDVGNKAGAVQGGPDIAKSALALASGSGGLDLKSIMGLLNQFFSAGFGSGSQDTSNLSQFQVNTYIQTAQGSGGNNYVNTDVIEIYGGQVNAYANVTTFANGTVYFLTLNTQGSQFNDDANVFFTSNSVSGNGLNITVTLSDATVISNTIIQIPIS